MRGQPRGTDEGRNVGRVRVGVDPALRAWLPEIRYVLTTLLRTAGCAYELDWWRPDSEEVVDIGYGPGSPSRAVAVWIRASGRAFTPEGMGDPGGSREGELLPVLSFEGTASGQARLDRGGVRFEDDLVLGCYWLLAGAAEPAYARQRWDNLDLGSSVLVRDRLLERPLVSLYGAFLRDFFRERGVDTEPWPWAKDGKVAAFAPSHDVDYPEMIRPVEAARLVAAGGFRAMRHLPDVWLGRTDFWKFREWQEFARSIGTRPTFYFMASRGSPARYVLGNPDAFYDIRSPRFQSLFAELREAGADIGLHASWHAHREAARFVMERERLEEASGLPVMGNRHHFWHLDPANPNETLRRQEAAGFLYDSSLAFEYHPGFRRGVCHPFRVFHAGERREIGVIQVPPAWMDDHFDRRLARNGIADPEASAARLLDVARATNGVIVVDYHVRGMNRLFFPRYGAWLERFVAEHVGSDFEAVTPAEIARGYEALEAAIEARSIDRIRDRERDVPARLSGSPRPASPAAIAPATGADDRSGQEAPPGHGGPARHYSGHVIARLGWFLSHLDREPDSPTYGSFDRDHWCWKFRDYPIGSLQMAAYPLALLWTHPFAANPCHRDPQVLAWIEAAVRQTIGRQHRDGGFDAVAPNERDPGLTLALVHVLAQVLTLAGDSFDPGLRERVRESIDRACRFAARRDEPHAFITNHRALMALGLLAGHELTGNASYRNRADELVAGILAKQSTEGWYHEYGGADPGYESLGIFYLAEYWRRTGTDRLLESLGRAVEFFSHFVHPDGSIGGVYGSRQTSLYFPGGFVLLADRLPLARRVAAFVAGRLERGNVVTPATTDIENFAPLAAAYLEAALRAAETTREPAAVLPCEQSELERWFGEAGLHVMATERYYAVTNGLRGGVCRVFDRRTGRVAHEDAGWLLEEDGRVWSSQFSGAGGRATVSQGLLRCETSFARVRPLTVTPARFLALRAANLTAFRSRRLGQWIRTRILRRLITGRSVGPFRLRRTLRFEPDTVHFHDEIEADARTAVRAARLTRRFTGIHMGSTRYFHESDLTPIPAVDIGTVTDALRRKAPAAVRFALAFPGPAAAEDPAGAASP